MSSVVGGDISNTDITDNFRLHKWKYKLYVRLLKIPENSNLDITQTKIYQFFSSRSGFGGKAMELTNDASKANIDIIFIAELPEETNERKDYIKSILPPEYSKLIDSSATDPLGVMQLSDSGVFNRGAIVVETRKLSEECFIYSFNTLYGLKVPMNTKVYLNDYDPCQENDLTGILASFLSKPHIKPSASYIETEHVFDDLYKKFCQKAKDQNISLYRLIQTSKAIGELEQEYKKSNKSKYKFEQHMMNLKSLKDEAIQKSKEEEAGCQM